MKALIRIVVGRLAAIGAVALAAAGWLVASGVSAKSVADPRPSAGFPIRVRRLELIELAVEEPPP